MFIEPFSYIQKFFLDLSSAKPKKTNPTEPKQESVLFSSAVRTNETKNIEPFQPSSSSSSSSSSCVLIKSIATELDTCRITQKGDGKYTLNRKPVIRNLVFSGGGTKGIAYPGIIEELEQKVDNESELTARDLIKNVAGSSIGATTAAFIACGVSSKKIFEILKNTNFENLMGDHASYKNPLKRDGIPFKNMINDTIKESILEYIEYTYRTPNHPKYTTDIQKSEVSVLFNKLKKDNYEVTFSDLNDLRTIEPKKFKTLHVTGFCKETKETDVFNCESTPELGIATACRASASLPVLLKDVEIEIINKKREMVTGHYADGGLSYNVPVHIFETEKFMRLEGEHGNNLETLVFAFARGREYDKPGSILQNPQARPKELFVPTRADRLQREVMVPLDGIHIPFHGGTNGAKQLNLLNISHRYSKQVFPVKVPLLTGRFSEAQEKADKAAEESKKQFNKFFNDYKSNYKTEEHDSLDSLLFALTDSELDEYAEKNPIDEKKVNAIKNAKVELKKIAHDPLHNVATKKKHSINLRGRVSDVDHNVMEKYFISELSKSLFKGSEGNDYRAILNALIYAIDTLPMRSYFEEHKRFIHQIRDQAVTAWRSTNPEAHEAALQQIAYKVSKLKEEIALPPELSRLYKSIYKLIDQQNSGSKKIPSKIRFVTSKLQFTKDLLAFFPEEKIDQVSEPLIPEPEINQIPKTIIDQILPHIHSFNSTIADQKYHIQEAEIARQIQELENPPIDTTTPIYFSKRKTGLAHSFLISKNEDHTYSILIKPNVKNKDYLAEPKKIPSEIMQKGSYKLVKKTGVLINISADKKTVVSVERQVIVSRGGESKDMKNIHLSSKHKMGATLIADGFKELKFQDDQKNMSRIIYTMPYLGESISQGWSHVRYVFQKRKLALALIDDVIDNGKNDIKPANLLLSPEKDRIHVIDFSDKLFTFTPGTKEHIYHRGAYDYSTPAEQEQARIFSLAITLWELQNPNLKGKLNFFATHNGNKLTKHKLIEYINSKRMNDILISPFFETVLKAYDCKLTKDELKKACENLL